ncbi:MAG TPA: hypothetical protein VGG32_06980 [Thermoplasmata archaeon]|jgi:5,10-methylene-tetrahydrofolate dehydrogenase/methenyl tetrahydrofolate cyclohydrolase
MPTEVFGFSVFVRAVSKEAAEEELEHLLDQAGYSENVHGYELGGPIDAKKEQDRMKE